MGSFKLTANTIYSGVESATGISQSTVHAALNGDTSAADKIFEFHETTKARAENGSKIFSALEEGLRDLDSIIKGETAFLNAASTTITNAQRAVSEVNKKDLILGNTLKETELKTRLELDAERQKHRIKLSLLPTTFKTERDIRDIEFQTTRYQLQQKLNDAKSQAKEEKKQLTPRQQKLESIRPVGSGANGVFGGVKNVLGWIFGG